VNAVRLVSDKLTPTRAELDELRAAVPPGPVVMINLLKFHPGGGRQAYRRYLHAAYKAFDPSAGPQPTPIYTGTAGVDLASGADWDFVIIAQWSSFDNFAHQQLTDGYLSDAVPLRGEALKRTLLMISTPAEPSAIWT
jgi:hypothetical protein